MIAGIRSSALQLDRLAFGAAVCSTTLAIGWFLSLATTRVANWFVMTDELRYERLAISVAQTGSPLPRWHGEVVANANQLYPILLSPLFGSGDVAASLLAAHRLNAFVMASAAIPVYLLARRTGVGRLLSLWAAVLSVAVPWIVLSSFLLTEVVAYPAFCWAVLACTQAVARATPAADVVALAAIAVAVLARTQFLVLAVVLAFAIVAAALLTAARDGHRGRALWLRAARQVGQHRILLAAYLAGAVVVAVAAVKGDAARLLGSYAATGDALSGFDLELLRFAAAHLAAIALGLAVVPFLIAAGWLVDRLRPSAPVPELAFASVGSAALVLLALQVAAFDRRFGSGLVKDRYLFYAVPVVLVALAASLGGRRWPRWWALAVPTGVCVVGFVSLPLPTYEKLNVDSPLATLNDELLRLATSVDWARGLLVVGALLGLALVIEATMFLPRRVVAAAVVAVATVALPAQTVYAFDRLFRVDGTNGLPITLDQGAVFGWIDRAVGGGGRVTTVRYPANEQDYWAGVAYWWDAEFWNESVVGELAPGAWPAAFDRRSGALSHDPETAYVVALNSDARFRLAGRIVAAERGAQLIQAERPWRAAWLTRGIYADGWTRPHVPARIVVFAEPAQRGAQERFLTLSIASPDPVSDRPVSVRSNLGVWHGTIPPNRSFERLVGVCVPPGGTGVVEIASPAVSAIYRDPTKGPLTGETDRPAGVLLRSIALADETSPRDRCPAATHAVAR